MTFRCHDAEACALGQKACPTPTACGCEAPACAVKDGTHKPTQALHNISEPRPKSLHLSIMMDLMSKEPSMGHEIDIRRQYCREAAAELRAQHARIAELEDKVAEGKRLLREEIDRANRYAEAALKAAPNICASSSAHLAQAAQAAVLVPRELLVRAVNSLGSFVGDEGWGQSDMDTMDDVVAMLAAPAHPAEGVPAVVAMPDELRDLLIRCRDFIDTTKEPVYPAGASLADEIDAALAATPAAPADPMDWPLPCDVTVGHGTMRKGVSLRTLVQRMKGLYEMATGHNADEVAARTPEQRAQLLAAFQAQIGAVEEPPAAAPVVLPEPDGYIMDSLPDGRLEYKRGALSMVDGLCNSTMPVYEAGTVRALLAQASAATGLPAQEVEGSVIRWVGNGVIGARPTTHDLREAISVADDSQQCDCDDCTKAQADALDAARLDFLIAEDNCVVCEGVNGFWLCWIDEYDHSKSEYQTGSHSTARAAIDAAIAARAAQAGKGVE